MSDVVLWEGLVKCGVYVITETREQGEPTLKTRLHRREPQTPTPSFSHRPEVCSTTCVVPSHFQLAYVRVVSDPVSPCVSPPALTLDGDPRVFEIFYGRSFSGNSLRKTGRQKRVSLLDFLNEGHSP